MAPSLLITLREGLEAALIIGIILASLARLDAKEQARSVWLGTALGVGVSLAAGAAIFGFFGELSGRNEEIFEGTAMFLAVGVLSYMVMWMKKQARNIKAHLERQVKTALEMGSTLALVSLAFIVVVREGVETVLFLFGASRSSTPMAVLTGGILGLVIAIALGYAGYKGSRRLNLGMFFNVTGVLLIFFSAGLLAHGIHEFQEAGIFPIIVEHVWDTNTVLDEKTGVGVFFKALFGYNGNPAVLEVGFYLVYLLGSLGLYFRPERRPIQLAAS